MKKIILLMAIVLISGIASAQPRNNRQQDKDPKARAEQRTERMAKDLSLTDKQKQQVLALNLAQAQEMQTLRAEVKEGKSENKDQLSKEQRDANRQKMQETKTANKSSYDAKLKSILTKDQFAKYTELQSQRKEKRDDNGKKPQKHNKGKGKPQPRG